MAIVGYARVSSVGQSLDIQLEKLEKAGCEKIYQEKKSGTYANRPELQKALDYVRKGDVFVFTKIDRLARSTLDFANIMDRLKQKGVAVRVLDQAIDTGTPAGKLMLDMLAAVAEFETAIRKERQMEGIAKAKAEGKVFGRKPLSEDTKQEILRLRADGVSFNKIAKALSISVGAAHKIAKAE